MRKLCSIFMLLAAFATNAQELNYREISLPSTVHKSDLDLLHTDKNGFLWLAAGPKLYRFDGSNFKTIHTDTSDRPQDRISTIFDDSQGNFWIGWQSGFISLIHRDSTKTYSPEEGIPAVRIVKWTEDTRGRLWMATYGEGLFLRDERGRWHNFSREDGLPSNESYDLVSMGNSVMLATDQGLAECSFSEERKKKVSVLNRSDGLSDQIAKTLFADTSGLWIGYYEPSLDRMPKDGKIATMPGPPANDAHLIARTGNTLWWLSENGRLFRKKADRQWEPVEVGGGRRAQVRHMALSRERHLWISTNRGLYLLDQWLERYPAENPVTAVHASDGLLWYSRGGDIYKKDLSTGSEELIWEGDHLILSLYADAQGRIWSGSFDGGVLIYDDETKSTTRFTEENGLVNNNVLSIDGNGSGLWLGTLGGVSHFPLDGTKNIPQPESFGQEEGRNVQYVYAVHVSDKGNVFLGTDGHGVLSWNGRHFTSLDEEVSEQVVLDLHSDASGKLWWITPQGELFGWSGDDGLEKVPAFSGEGGRAVGLQIDPRGGILVFHEFGIRRWDVESEVWSRYGSAFGLSDFQPELHAQSFGNYNQLYVGTANGIYALALDFLPPRPQPDTYITEVELFLEHTEEAEFAFDENHITFNYIGRWYTDPDAVRYKVKLEGYDLNWAISQNTQITYPQLPPGRYTFYVVAGINDHFPEEELKSYSFTIHPPWHGRWYNILVLALLLMLLGIGIFRWRVKRLKHEQQQEQEKVRAQYEAIKSQVNPHFLFNSFNTLMALIEDDKEEATAYLSSLSDFFRNILQFREIDLISLREELEIVRTYLGLQEKRFGPNLRISIEIPGSSLENLIPPLTLQLLVENAFKHNVISKSKPLELWIFAKGDYLVVRNLLQKKSQRETSTGYGLDSIRKKYSFYTKKEIKVKGDHSYFAVHLPLIPNA